MKITVTKKDIEKGQMGSGCFCPVALAIKRTKKFKRVAVSHTYVCHNKGYSILPKKSK